MSITQISVCSATWTETSITVSGGTPLAGSMFQTLLTNLQQLCKDGEKQIRSMDISRLAADGEPQAESGTRGSLFSRRAELTPVELLYSMGRIDHTARDDILEWLKFCRAQPISVREIQWRTEVIEANVTCRLAAEEGLAIERADTLCAQEAC